MTNRDARSPGGGRTLRRVTMAAAATSICVLAIAIESSTSGALTPSAPTITSPATATFEVGVAGTFTVAASGSPAPTIVELGKLPTGITFSAGVFSGTPATGTSGGYALTIVAENGVSPDAIQFFTLSVEQAPAFTSAAATTFTVGSAGSFTVKASGTPPSTFSEVGALPTGVAFSSLGVLAGTAPSGTAGTYPITITASNGASPSATQSFTLIVATLPAITSGTTTTFTVGSAGTFSFSATGSPVPIFSVSGSLPSGVTLSSTGLLSGTPTAGASGVYALTITASNGASPSATQSFTLDVVGPPVITSANDVGFVAGRANSFTVTAAALPSATFSETGTLPGGVSFNTATGVLSSTAALSATGNYAITLGATNGHLPNASQSFTLIVGSVPVITSASSALFATGRANSFTLSESGFPTAAFSLTGRLPRHIRLVDMGNGTATLSGVPFNNHRGIYRVVITAKSLTGTAVQDFTLVVEALPVFRSRSSTTFTVGLSSSFRIKTISYPHPSIAISNGSLPSGLVLIDTGNGKALISGVPKVGTAGTYPFTLKATMVLGSTTQAFTLTVAP